MSVSPAADRRSTRQHAHRPNGLASEVCPYCGQPISRKEFREIQAKIEVEEKARLAKLETALKAQFAAAQQQTAEKAQAAIEKARKDAAAQVAKAKREAAARESTIRQEAASAATAALAPKIAEAVNSEKAKGYAERLKLTEQLEDLRIKLERRDRPSGQLGDEGEVDVLTVLTEKFASEGDEILRFKKFARGGDIEHRLAGGAGLVLYEVKNHRKYQSKWTARAKENQIAAQADHVVIVTTAFPANDRELMLSDDGVLVVSPARLLAVAMWLRAFTIRTNSLKLSNQQRFDKAGRLYSFMTSDRVADRWNRMSRTMSRMREAVRVERSQHEKSWTDRTDQIDVLNTIQQSFVDDLSAVFEGMEPSP
jgi:hypothetical protein